jgi:hypothetical protein
MSWAEKGRSKVGAVSEQGLHYQAGQGGLSITPSKFGKGIGVSVHDLVGGAQDSLHSGGLFGLAIQKSISLLIYLSPFFFILSFFFSW